MSRTFTFVLILFSFVFIFCTNASIAFVPLLVTLGFLYPVAAIIGSICREKELRQKELMKMMSVSESDIGWAWFTTLFVMYLVIATAMMGVSTQLYVNSSAFLLWIFWLFSCLAILVFSMFIASFSSKTTRSVLIGLILIFVGIFLPLIVNPYTGSTGLVALLSLHPITAMSYGLQEIGYLEDAGIGLTANTAGSSDHPSGFTAASSISSLIIDCILWGVLAWYLNRVIRPDYGQALPFYFPFTLSYWCPGTSHSGPPSAETDEDANPEVPIEPVSDTLRVSFLEFDCDRLPFPASPTCSVHLTLLHCQSAMTGTIN
jgi:ABC-2 family transporter protein